MSVSLMNTGEYRVIFHNRGDAYRAGGLEITSYKQVYNSQLASIGQSV